MARRNSITPKWLRRIVGGSTAALVLVVAVFGVVVVGILGTAYMLVSGDTSGGGLTRPPDGLDKPRTGGWPAWGQFVTGVTDAYQDATTPEQRNALANWWGNLW